MEWDDTLQVLGSPHVHVFEDSKVILLGLGEQRADSKAKAEGGDSYFLNMHRCACMWSPASHITVVASLLQLDEALVVASC